MKTRHSKRPVTLLALAAATTLALTAQAGLKVGDPAPKLQTGKWVQGEPVKEFQSGKAYIVEFWATWCGPCRASIPHLNEIANKYKDKGLIVIGQNCWEENDETAVAPFIKKMGEKMTYRVALDDKSDSKKGKMSDTWMAAAGRNGIPSAFLVDTKGKIAWIGHPMQLKEQIIEDVLAGKFDTHKAAEAYEKEQGNMAKLRIIWSDLHVAMQKKDWDKVEAKLAEADKLMPEDQRDVLDQTRFNLLIGKKEYPAAYKLAEHISDTHKSDYGLLNDLAWQIATDTSIEKRDLTLAEKIATRANDAAKGKEASILDTLARIQFMRDKKDQAIATQEQAVKLVEDSNAKKGLEASLASYKKGELPKAD
ncbi:MAG: hypothetical protein DME25_13650 [Verrucomicrobia bacterium]|nr:MAG: hypothetical protein DME25_13650 [Verrucomicrobiota bacterium]